MFANLDGQKKMDAYEACRRAFLLTLQLKPRCKNADDKCAKISAWSVGQHIEHTLAVNARVVVIVSGDSTTKDPEKVPATTQAGLRILETGAIPRGVGKAPETVLPKLTNYVDLHDDVERNAGLLDDLTVIHESIATDTALYPHPALGGLTKMQWLRFLEIHIQHHMKIISDIVQGF